MAITTMDGLVSTLAAGQDITFNKASVTVAAGFWYSLLSVAGSPGAGSLAIGNTGSGALCSDATAGAPAINAYAGGNTGYLAEAGFTNSVASQVILYDRLFHAGSYACNSSSAVTTPLTNQATYQNFASRLPNANYNLVEAWVEVNTVMAAYSASVYFTYYNQNGSGPGTRTSTTVTLPSSCPSMRMYPIPLQAGDTGISQINSVVVNGGSSSNTGTLNIVLLRRLTSFSIPAVAVSEPRQDAFKLGLPQLGLGADNCLCLMVMVNTGTASGAIVGDISIING